MRADPATLAFPFQRRLRGVCVLLVLVFQNWPASVVGSSVPSGTHWSESQTWVWPWSSRDDDRRILFEQALVDAGSGDPRRTRRALETMNDLAPHRRPGGYLPAHEWLAEHHTALARQEKDPSGQRYHLDLAETHWMRVLILDRDHQAAHMHLAHLYMSLFRFDRAESHLKYLLEHGHDDGVQLHLAEVYLRTDRPEEARRCAAAARRHFARILDTGKSEEQNVLYRMNLARALTILKKYSSDAEGPGAIDVLMDGYRLSQNNLYRKRLAEVHVQRMADLPKDAFEERLAIYDEIIRHDPYNVSAFQYLAASLRKDNPLYQQAQDQIDAMLARTSSATFYFLLSNKYLQENDYDRAKRHLESALRINPSLLVACNNLAYLLVFRTNPPEYDRALRIIDGALEHATTEHLSQSVLATFYDTRGQIHVAKGDYEEGVTDLTKAIDLGYGRSIETIDCRKALMRAYVALGQNTLADEQSRIIRLMETSPRPSAQP